MAFDRYSDTIKHALDKAGESVIVNIDGRGIAARAVIQNAGKNFMRKYDNEAQTVRVSGRDRARDKVAFISYIPDWEECDSVFVTWRGKNYLVLADSVMRLGDNPAYIWALLAEKVPLDGGDYDDIDGGDYSA